MDQNTSNAPASPPGSPKPGNTAPAAAAKSTTAAALAGAVASAAPAVSAPTAVKVPETSPEDIGKAKDILLQAVGQLTGQAKEEITAYAEANAPLAAAYATMAGAGDEKAATALRALQVTLLMTVGVYGIRLLQMHEQAFLSAVRVGLGIAFGPSGADAATVAGTAIAGVISEMGRPSLGR